MMSIYNVTFLAVKVAVPKLGFQTIIGEINKCFGYPTNKIISDHFKCFVLYQGSNSNDIYSSVFTLMTSGY